MQNKGLCFFRGFFFFLIVLTSVTTLPAQVYIQGVVLDKDSGSPVPDVIVQYGSSSQAFTYTDGKGRFRMPENSEAIIHFQCFGYKPRSIPKSIILQNKKVILEMNPLSLDPVVISPDDADKLLNQAMLNTKKNLLVNKPLSYLLHFLQDRTADTLQNEVYLKYSTFLDARTLKKSLKKDKVPYVFNLIEIKRMQKAEIPTSDLFGAEYHASHLFTFGKSVNNETYKSYSSDSSLIILKIQPLKGRNGAAKGEVLINRDDLTINSMTIESVDSVLINQPYKRYLGKQVKTLKKTGYFSFKKYGSESYLSDGSTFYKFETIDEYGKEEYISYYCDIDFRGFVEKEQLRKRRLSGFCQELFYFPDSTDKEFWLDEFNENLEMQYQGSGIAGNKNIGLSSKDKIIRYSSFAIVVGLVALLVK